jgi:putative endonuclease
LLAAGLVLVGRNVRVGRLEIDIVAREGVVIVVVEVRSRGTGAWVRAMDTVDWKKRARVRKAGEALWRKRYQSDASVERMRFDIVTVSFGEDGEAHAEHARAAF